MQLINLSIGYRDFLFKNLNIPNVTVKEGTNSRLWLVPVWCAFVLRNGSYASAIYKTYREVIDPFIKDNRHNHVHDVDLFWFTLIAWMLEEDPSIESSLNSAISLAGEEGLLSIVDAYCSKG